MAVRVGRRAKPGGGELSSSPESARAARAAHAPWRENRPTDGWLPRVDFRDLWEHREVAAFLALRDVRLRYRQTAFGVAWAIIRPLAAAAIFTIVFGRLVDVPSDGLPYVVFAYAGLTIWTYVSSAVEAAANSLIEDRALVTKVAFPRVLAPVASTLPGLLDLAISLVILGVFMTVTGVAPSAALVVVPVSVAGAVAVSIGAGLLLSALNVKYRDVRYALGFALQTWLFASPVVYPSSLFDGAWRYVFAANPLVGVIDGFRWSVAGAPPPGAYVLVSLATGTLVLAAGVLVFSRMERRFADVV
ncbi:MAG TPA: ABC transporter permease [Gaiellaceae bacterium]|nr:ABC transporter permease [Gaiellaceae bacterium]